MTCDIQACYAISAKARAGRRLRQAILSTIIFMAVVTGVGCHTIGSPDPRLVGQWEAIPSSYGVESGILKDSASRPDADRLILKADGSYKQSMGIFPVNVQNSSGRWGVTGGQLRLQEDKTNTIFKYKYNLNERGDQLQLTLDGEGTPFKNMSRIPVTYQRVSTPQ